jgi:hypothetical protein
MEIRLPVKSTRWKSNCAQPREAMAWRPVAARFGTPLLRQIARHKPCSALNVWFSLGASPHRAWRTGETYLRPLSGMAGSQGSGEGMGIVELTTAGYEARRRVWGQISDKKIADLARRIEVRPKSATPFCCPLPLTAYASKWLASSLESNKRISKKTLFEVRARRRVLATP